MLHKHYVGGKHIPENLLFKSRLKSVPKDLRKECEDEYAELLQRGVFIRLKKRTGKRSDWHISLNPEMLAEINELVEDTYDTV